MQSDRNFLMGGYYKQKTCKFQPKYRFNGKTKEDFNSWKPKLLAELKKQMWGVMLIFGVICSVSVLLMFCIFYMIVMTRQKDIAVIKSCGASSTAVAMIYVDFGACVGAIGSIVGAFLGYLPTDNPVRAADNSFEVFLLGQPRWCELRQERHERDPDGDLRRDRARDRRAADRIRI